MSAERYAERRDPGLLAEQYGENNPFLPGLRRFFGRFGYRLSGYSLRFTCEDFPEADGGYHATFQATGDA